MTSKKRSKASSRTAPDTDTPIYEDALERFRHERNVDVQAIQHRKPWTLAAAKRRLAIPAK